MILEATERAAQAIPDAQIRVLVGHGHCAHRTDPHVEYGIIREFIAS